MTPAESGLLVIWTDVAPEAEADFNAWYDQEHLTERVGVPGFLNGRRYVAIDGPARYLAWYETETPDVLGSSAYGARQANPTPWTARIMPSFRNVTRVTASRLAKAGEGLGAAAATLAVRPEAGREDALDAALRSLVQEVGAAGFVVAAQAWRPSAADAAAGTAEAQLRATEENPPAWGIVVEATGAEDAAAALAAAGAADRIGDAAGGAVEIGLYRLLLARGRF